MKIDNVGWWLILLWNFVSYFIYSFGNISRGNSKLLIEFVGGALFFLSFVAMFIFFGLWSGLILMAITFMLVSPIVGLLIAHIEKKLYGHYKKIEQIKFLQTSASDQKSEKFLKALNAGMLKQHQQNHPELEI